MIGFLFHHVWWVLAAVAVIAAIAYAPAAAWKFKWQIALLLACAVAAVFWQQASSLRLTLAQRDAADAKAQADAQGTARQTELGTSGDLAAVDARAQEDSRHGQEALAAVDAGRNSGTLQLRDNFKCPATSVPGPAAAAGQRDAAPPAQLSREDEDFLVRFAAEADDVARRLNACQDTIAVYQRRFGTVAP